MSKILNIQTSGITPIKVVGVVGYIETRTGFRSLLSIWASQLSSELLARFNKHWYKTRQVPVNRKTLCSNYRSINRTISHTTLETQSVRNIVALTRVMAHEKRMQPSYQHEQDGYFQPYAFRLSEYIPPFVIVKAPKTVSVCKKMKREILLGDKFIRTCLFQHRTTKETRKVLVKRTRQNLTLS